MLMHIKLYILKVSRLRKMLPTFELCNGAAYHLSRDSKLLNASDALRISLLIWNLQGGSSGILTNSLQKQHNYYGTATQYLKIQKQI
jgi:hypothetical protein